MIYKNLNVIELKKKEITVNKSVISFKNGILIITCNTSFVYGLGERFNQVNQLGLNVENKVTEQFCNQGDKTYFPLPFFFLENNLGFYIDTKKVFSYRFKETEIEIIGLDKDTELYILEGSYKNIISDFIILTKRGLLPPKWIFGPWMSAHRWNSQKLILEQLNTLKQLELPITALVIEQWSDEATFYTFNEAKYEPKEKALTYEEYTYDKDAKWPNPKQMIEEIHNAGLKVLLWQAPMVKELEPHEEENKQHTIDRAYVVKHNLVVKEGDKPYQIPKGNWFPGSMVPDFTNPETVKWWFDKRKYLFDIGIDGFKTDGGEFIHSKHTTFHSEETGYEMLNDYSRLFIESYKNNLNSNQALFSRAGYAGQQANTILWAGDQKSTWDELRGQYSAGLSASLSGQHLWSFDIGGFAGDLPSVELYLRATQLAVFTPVMQFHSEPVGGQFALLDPSEVMNNERSPWNIAKHYNREDILEPLKKLYWLRMNLVPYIYSEALKAQKDETTIMKHMIIDYPRDKKAKLINNQHLFGDLLVVPVLKENQTEVNVYLPSGTWYNIFTNKTYKGKKQYTFTIDDYDMIVFIPEGCGLILNNEDLFSKKSNQLLDDNLHIRLYGESGSQRFVCDKFDYTIVWENNEYSVKGPSPNNLVVSFIK